MILDELRPYNVSQPFFRFKGRGPSNSHDFPTQDDEGVAASKTEGTDLSNTAISTGKATATAGTVGMMATVTDELTAISLLDFREHTARVLGRSVAEKRETDYTALMDDFSNTTGSSGVDAVATDILDAVTSLRGRDVTGQLVAVLHTVQVGDIQRDVATTGASLFANPNTQVNGMVASGLNGFAGTLFDIPIFQTQLIPTANAGADRAGGIFTANEALGLYEIWGPRTELERDASNVATEVVTTARYGVVEIDDARGQSLITDA